MPLASRPFQDPGDIPAIHQLLREIARRDPAPAYLSIADFEWWQAFVGSAFTDTASNASYAACGFEVADVVTVWERRQET